MDQHDEAGPPSKVSLIMLAYQLSPAGVVVDEASNHQHAGQGTPVPEISGGWLILLEF